MQGFDPSAIVGAGIMVMLLLFFIIFMLWQKLGKRGTGGLDLGTYNRMKERRERLAGYGREQKRPLEEPDEEADAYSMADMAFRESTG